MEKISNHTNFLDFFFFQRMQKWKITVERLHFDFKDTIMVISV